MLRAAKRAAATVRGSTATASSTSRPSAAHAVWEAGKSTRGQRRPLHADGLVPSHLAWELEAVAARRLRANGDDAAATAVDMVKALVRLALHANSASRNAPPLAPPNDACSLLHPCV